MRLAAHNRKKVVATVSRLRARLQANRRIERTFLRKNRSKRYKACSDVAPPVGLEPTTLRLTAACSTN